MRLIILGSKNTPKIDYSYVGCFSSCFQTIIITIFINLTQKLVSYSFYVLMELLIVSLGLFIFLILKNRLITPYGILNWFLGLIGYLLKEMIIDLFTGMRCNKKTTSYIDIEIPRSNVSITKWISVSAVIKLSSRVSFLGANATSFLW